MIVLPRGMDPDAPGPDSERYGPFHQVQGHRLGRRLVSTTAEDIEAVSLEAKILRARSRPRLQPTYRISVLKTPVTWPARANWERRVLSGRLRR